MIVMSRIEWKGLRPLRRSNMTANDMTYQVTISHIKELYGMGIFSKKEFDEINKELIAKYHPLIEDDLIDFELYNT